MIGNNISIKKALSGGIMKKLIVCLMVLGFFSMNTAVIKAESPEIEPYAKLCTPYQGIEVVSRNTRIRQGTTRGYTNYSSVTQSGSFQVSNTTKSIVGGSLSLGGSYTRDAIVRKIEVTLGATFMVQSENSQTISDIVTVVVPPGKTISASLDIYDIYGSVRDFTLNQDCSKTYGKPVTFDFSNSTKVTWR